MNKFNQKGIAHLGLVVLMVALLISGVAGFVVYQKNKDYSKDNNTQSTENTKKDDDVSIPETDAPQYKNIYDDKVGRFTVNYPDNWTLEKRNDLSAGESVALLKEKSGLYIDLSTGVGGYGITSQCDYDEITGRSIWSGAEPERKDPCPYTIYHDYKKLMTTAKVGGAQKNLYVVKKSYGDDKDRTFTITVTSDDVVKDKKIYGVDAVIRGLTAEDRDGVVARLEPFGNDISYFDKDAAKEAFNILSTFKLY